MRGAACDVPYLGPRRLFLKKMKTDLRIPVLGLVDSDPYGLKARATWRCRRVAGCARVPVDRATLLMACCEQILSVYMSGSKNMSYDSSNLTTPDIKWLGVRPSDLDRCGLRHRTRGCTCLDVPDCVRHPACSFNIPQQCRLPMTEADIQTGRQLLQEDFIKSNPKCDGESCAANGSMCASGAYAAAAQVGQGA
jgi:meiotic recombination protein SPO11